MDVAVLQQFATDLRKVLSQKTVVNVIGTIFAILRFAEKIGNQVSKVSFSDLILGESIQPEVPFFTKAQAVQIIEAAKEPYKTIFAVAWSTGLRAGELLALTKDDLGFERRTIRVNKSADDKNP